MLTAQKDTIIGLPSIRQEHGTIISILMPKGRGYSSCQILRLTICNRSYGVEEYHIKYKLHRPIKTN